LEDDEYDRLSKVWRGFNAFYNHLSPNPQMSEIDKIRNFAKSLCERNSSSLTSIVEEYWTPLPKPPPLNNYLEFLLFRRKCASVIDCLIGQNFIDRKGTNHSQSLATAKSAMDARSTLESALLCVYVERNRVMHGEVITKEEKDLLYICAAFLQRVVAVAMNEFYF
jgi:hypothetical protein